MSIHHFYIYYECVSRPAILGPINRVSIPKDNEGRIKTFGFVEYKHLSSVDFAMNIFKGTKVFGRELFLKNRNSTANRSDRDQRDMSSSSLLQGYGGSSNPYLCADLAPSMIQTQHHILQQQLLMMATGQQFQNAPQMFGVSPNSYDYASQRSDNTGSQRDHFVDRNRYHREENRSGRSKPYRRSRSRSRSRSPQQQQHSNKSRERSPMGRGRNQGRKQDDRSGGYHRWGKR